jgi:hypothetical protein
MAVAILTCNRVLAHRDGWPSSTLDERSRQALVDVPEAARWGPRFTSDTGDMGPSPKAFGRHTAPCIVPFAVEGIAQACIPEPDDPLRDSSLGRSASVSPGLTPLGPRPSLPPSTGPEPRSRRCRRNRTDRQTPPEPRARAAWPTRTLNRAAVPTIRLRPLASRKRQSRAFRAQGGGSRGGFVSETRDDEAIAVVESAVLARRSSRAS